MEASKNALESYLALGKHVQGKAAVDLIQKATADPALFEFAELLELEGIKALAGSADDSYHKLLQLFAFGSWKDLAHMELPSIASNQVTKLKQLSLITLAGRMRSLPYEVILLALDLKDSREIEDLVIKCIYAGILRGKLDTRNQRLVIEQLAGRDLGNTQDLDSIITILSDWSAKCKMVLNDLQQQIQNTRENREEQSRQEATFDSQIRQQTESIKEDMAAAKKAGQQTLDFAAASNTRKRKQRTKR
jgi:COP9 signalosome complex subunit 7